MGKTARTGPGPADYFIDFGAIKKFILKKKKDWFYISYPDLYNNFLHKSKVNIIKSNFPNDVFCSLVKERISAWKYFDWKAGSIRDGEWIFKQQK